MNQDQVISLIRAVVKVGGGYLIARGLATDSQMMEVAGGLSAVAGLIWGLLHRVNPAPLTNQQGRLPLTLMVAALFILPVGVSVTGCKSPPERQVFTTVKAPAVTLNAAMTLWGDYVRQFPQTPETERKVLTLYKRARLAELAAIDAGHAAADAFTASGGTNGVSTVGLIYTAAQSPEAQAALNELLGLLRQLGLKI